MLHRKKSPEFQDVSNETALLLQCTPVTYHVTGRQDRNRPTHRKTLGYAKVVKEKMEITTLLQHDAKTLLFSWTDGECGWEERSISVWIPGVGLCWRHWQHSPLSFWLSAGARETWRREEHWEIAEQGSTEEHKWRMTFVVLNKCDSSLWACLGHARKCRRYKQKDTKFPLLIQKYTEEKFHLVSVSFNV